MLFRKKISATDAVERMLMIVKIASTDSRIQSLEKQLETVPNHLAKEVITMALFGVYISTKFSRFSGWREQGRSLFDSLLDKVVDNLVQNYGVPEILAREPIEHTFAMHSVSCDVHADDPAGLKRALGENLNAFVSTHTSEEVISLGARVFTNSFEAVVDLHKTYKLVV